MMYARTTVTMDKKETFRPWVFALGVGAVIRNTPSLMETSDASAFPDAPSLSFPICRHTGIESVSLRNLAILSSSFLSASIVIS